MNKKIKECENVEFLPEPVRDSKKLDPAEKNVLGTLCFYYLSHSIYAAKNDGWFFKDQKTIIEESNLSEAQGKRVLLKLILKKLIERASGTNHKCTHYRLCKEIRELMPENPETDDVDLERFANEPLDKNRLDESSKDEDSREEKNTKEIGSPTPLEGGVAPRKSVMDEMTKEDAEKELKEHSEKLRKRLEEATAGIKDLRQIGEICSSVWSQYSNPLMFKPYTDNLKRVYLNKTRQIQDKALNQ